MQRRPPINLAGQSQHVRSAAWTTGFEFIGSSEMSEVCEEKKSTPVHYVLDVEGGRVDFLKRSSDGICE